MNALSQALTGQQQVPIIKGVPGTQLHAGRRPPRGYSRIKNKPWRVVFFMSQPRRGAVFLQVEPDRVPGTRPGTPTGQWRQLAG